MTCNQKHLGENEIPTEPINDQTISAPTKSWVRRLIYTSIAGKHHSFTNLKIGLQCIYIHIWCHVRLVRVSFAYSFCESTHWSSVNIIMFVEIGKWLPARRWIAGQLLKLVLWFPISDIANHSGESIYLNCGQWIGACKACSVDLWKGNRKHNN